MAVSAEQSELKINYLNGILIVYEFLIVAFVITLIGHMCNLKGCVTFLGIVFVGQCEVLVLIWYIFFFFSPLAAKLIGPRTGCQFLKKNVDFFR